MSNELTISEQAELATNEAVISKGLDTFLTVGVALHNIKTKKLYRAYGSFAEYCDSKWGITLSQGNYLARTGGIATDLEGLPTPTHAHHVEQLKILDDPVLRRKAWQNANNNANGKLTGKQVELAAQEQAVRNCGVMRIVDDFTNGRIALTEAWALWQQLYVKPNYPAKFVNAYELYGGKLETFKALKQFGYSWEDELDSILATGWLDTGTMQIPLNDLNPSEVTAFGKRLSYEAIAIRKAEAGVKQKAQVRAKMLSGFEILGDSLDEQLIYLYPEGNVELKQLAQKLEQAGKQVLLVVAYDAQNEPDINFGGGSKIKPSTLNGVKPAPLMELMRTL